MTRLSTRFGAALVGLVALATTGMGALRAPVASAADDNAVTVTASEYKFKVSGNPKSGWTQVTFSNDGEQFHMLLAIPLKAGVTLAQVKKAALGKNGEAAVGKLTGKGSTAGIPFLIGPGESSTTISKLDAGHYALVCFFTAPDGSRTCCTA